MNPRSIGLVFKKDLKSYFNSYIAYAVIAIFAAATGYLFFNLLASFSVLSFQAQANPMVAKQYNLLNVNETVVRPLFGNISIVMLLMLPLLTMKLLADEKKSGTMELLLTYPVKDAEVVMGKFFACLAVFAAMLLSTVSYPLLLIYLGEPEIVPIITGYCGLFMLGAAFISLGIFTSSLTENQIIAASLSVGILFCFWLMSYSTMFVSPTIAQIISYLSMNDHLASLAKGVVDTEDIIYFLVFTGLFLFLTLRSLESNRWR
ncbi:MAG: ABC transporter permease subunit [Alphaproteobacteria bacterium]|nr:ABC transporter permease [Rhodospirillaceae bacterium]MDP6022514.1 ABC transporter permease subunit [Alphaproteobacteria bacterium]MDP6256243.1 ABC transporter permease subunit [Alphaproteobacteria bacterium]MDP7054788.1 ABC transporter permease subunit [Alphaproteobacteria bacterium]MDP7229511.1 ABC transporter permease subunit [Alphaproteobacteria bacterium]